MGSQQKIAFFHHIQANAAPTAAPVPAPPNEFTNKAETRSERSTILVFDLLNSSITEQSKRARRTHEVPFGIAPELGEPICLLAFDAYGISLTA